MNPLKSLYLLTFILLANFTFSQHCQYDNTALVGVIPISPVDGKIVNGLKMNVLDDEKKPLIRNKDIYRGNDHYLRSEEDTVEFWRNPKPSRDTEHRNRNRRSRHYIHAKNHYICLLGSQGSRENHYFIQIEDIDGAKNGGDFATQIVPINEENYQGLCNYGAAWGLDYDTTDYQPIKILLAYKEFSPKSSGGNIPTPKQDTIESIITIDTVRINAPVKIALDTIVSKPPKQPIYSMSQENCLFNHYNKRGGHFAFSTYYYSDMHTPLDGICQQISDGKVYERRVFSKGRLTEAKLHYFNSTIREELEIHLNPIGNKIGFLKMYAEDGTLTQHSLYYYDKNHRRCELSKEYYPNGKLRFEQSYAWLKKEDLDPSEYKNHPPHLIDDEGYTYQKVNISDYKSYYENGQVKEQISYDKPVNHFSLNQKEGLYKQYYENGKLQTEGFYKEDNPDSTWISYSYNGKISEQGSYQNGVKVGMWQAFYDDGTKKYEYFYDTDSNHLFEPSKLAWSQMGVKVLEISLDKAGNGFQKIWTDKGVLTQETEIIQNSKIMGLSKTWYDSGALKSVLNNHLKADTFYVEYFENGKCAQLKIHKDFADNIRKGKQTFIKEWNEKGILTTEIEKTTAEDFNNFVCLKYDDAGVLISTVYHKNKERLEEYFFHNGRPKCFLSKVDALLNGPYQTFDSLGNVLQKFSYHLGLRHGIFRTYNANGVLIFQQKYIDGCIDSTFKEAILPTLRLLSTLSAKEKEAIYDETRVMLYKYGHAFPNKLFFSPQEIDSLAQVLLWFKEGWDTKKVYPFEALPAQDFSFTFYLPKVLFQGIEVCDTSNKYVKELYQSLQKAGWEYPKTVKTEGENYRIVYKDNHLYTSAFYREYFSFYLNQHFAFYTEPHLVEPSFGEKRERKFSHPSQLYVRRLNDCYYTAHFSHNEGSYEWRIYNDGSIEFYNQQYQWEDVKEGARIIEMPWD